MLRFLGGVLLIGGSVGAGLGFVATLTARWALLRALVESLEWMERELSFHLTPMSVLFGTLAERSGTPTAAFFADCHAGLAHLGEVPLQQVWQRAVGERLTALNEEDREAVSALGLVLGRYDGQAEREALQQAAERLKGCCREAKGERDRLGRVYGMLGLAAGVFLVVLLF